MAALGVAIEPGVGDDERRRTGEEGGPGTPRAAARERVLEELEATAVISAPAAKASSPAVIGRDGGRQTPIAPPITSALEAITANRIAVPMRGP